MALLVWIVVGLLVGFVGTYVAGWDRRDIRLYVYAAGAAVFGGLMGGVFALALIAHPLIPGAPGAGQAMLRGLMNVLTNPLYAVRGAAQWAIIATAIYLYGLRRGWWR